VPHRIMRGARVSRVLAGTLVLIAGVLSAGASTAAAERGTGKPVDTSPPVITTAPVERRVVKVERGRWSGASPIQFTYSWARCNASGAECETIGGAQRSSYVPTATDVGHRLVATVKASNSEGSTEASSAPSAVVAAGVPRHLKAPAISGHAVDGRLLTVSEGAWKGAGPLKFTYQWEDCKGRTCSVISGAQSSTYRAQTTDIGYKLRVRVTASNSAGTGSVYSKRSAKVVPGSPLNIEAPSISGTPVAEQTLTANEGTWVGTPPISYSYQWYSCPAISECAEISGATEKTYTVQPLQTGESFEVVVTGKNAYGSEAVTSPKTSIAGSGAEAPENVLAPEVVGLTVTGQMLTATEGTWTGTEPIKYAYQWELCNSSGGSCEELVGATESKYTIPSGEVEDTLRVIVTAGNAGGEASKTSEASTEILGLKPTSTEAPSVTGTATAGQILKASEGKWTGTEPISYTYQWERCSTAGTECAEVSGQVLPVYDVGSEDVGHTLRVAVKATNVAGSTVAYSPTTATVGAVKPENVLAPEVVGLTVTGQMLTATEGTWTGTEPIKYAYQWELCNSSGGSCKELVGATESKYTIPSGEVEDTLRVIVTAGNAGGEASKTSEASTEILGLKPTNTQAPSVTGTATAGQILKASEGKWTGTEPIAYEYEWLRCSTAGTECTTAQAASLLPTYTVAAADVGHTLRVKVIAKNVAGSGSAESEHTATVAGVKPEDIIAPAIVGAPVSGTESTATEGTWTGTEPIKYAFQWKLCSSSGTSCSEIAGATKSKYTPPSGDVGKTLRVLVTASNVAGSTAKESEPSLEILL
jgi:hypothetical protein